MRKPLLLAIVVTIKAVDAPEGVEVECQVSLMATVDSAESMDIKSQNVARNKHKMATIEATTITAITTTWGEDITETTTTMVVTMATTTATTNKRII
jgi:hypothetical protein